MQHLVTCSRPSVCNHVSMASTNSRLCIGPAHQDFSFHLDAKREWVYFKCTWEIRKFSTLAEKSGQVVVSPLFSTSNCCNSKMDWCLSLYPKGESEAFKGYVSVYLLLCSCTQSKISLYFDIRILNAEGQQTREFCNFYETFTPDCASSGFNQLIDLDYLYDVKNNLLPGDTLTLQCDGSYRADGNTSENAPEFIFPDEQMVAHIGSLFGDDTLCDVTLSTSGKVLRAHKCILAARSSVFAAMFKHKMKENIEDNVDINDIEYPVLCELVHFMYTARKSKSLDEMADKLLMAANKYNIKELYTLCEESLINNLSVANIISRLVLADMYSAHELKTGATRFIETHFHDIVHTGSWKDLFMSHPVLAYEINVALIEHVQELLQKEKGQLLN